MKKTTATYSSIAAFLIILMICLSPAKTYNYNDIPSMEAKIAKELNIKQVSIFDSQDIDNCRIVAYTDNNRQGFAVFKQNKKEDYIFDSVTTTDRMINRGVDIYVDYYDGHDAKNNPTAYWICVSNNENLDTIQFKIKEKGTSNSESIIRKITDCPSINIIQLPNVSHETEYNFYDNMGNLIR